VATVLVTPGLAALMFVMPSSATAADNIGTQDPICDLSAGDQVITSPHLSVLTLNLAHGRKDALNQMLQKTSTTRKNLEEIAGFLSNSGADLIALQEADAPSRWSGKFNHVEFVSQKSPYPCRLHASHAHKYMYDFGTALLSRVPFSDSILHTFAPSPPTTNKGFVMGEVHWNPGGTLPEPINVSVISVHLDFSRQSVRESQIEEMRKLLPDIATPVIILGDFNTDWTTNGSALKAIVENGNFKVFQPESTQLGTYKKGKHRLDWILISEDLEFVSYEVPQLVLSDHQPVQANLRLVDRLSKVSDSSPHE
jgi:endonuclease/exonuclease/phosphatase family metal-dependent hydrolase